MDKPTASPAVGAKQQIEKQARQLAYDTRYKVKQAMSAKSGAKLDPAAVRKAYMSQLGKSSAAPAVKARAKQMLLGEDLINAKELANESIVSALYKVFVEGIEDKEVVEENEYIQSLNESDEKKYKIRVTDKKTGNTYVRMATRPKIAELRRNPNIASVEMTGYGEVSKSEASKGESTAKAKSGQGLDPVGQEDKDVDNDGDHDKSDKYLMKRRKAVGKAIATRKEEVIYEKEEESDKKITGKGVNNYKSKSVKVFPEVSEQAEPAAPEKKTNNVEKKKLEQQNERTRQQEVQILQRKLQALRSAPRGSDPAIMASYEPEGEDVQEVAPPGMEKTVKKMKKHPELSRGTTPEGKKKNIYALAWYMYNKKRGVEEECGCEEEPKSPKKDEMDVREIPTKVNLAKNKMRAMGLKMSYEPDGEVIDERTRERKGQPRPARDRAMEIMRKMPSYRVGGMTRSGGTVAGHEEKRGVKKQPGAPTPKGETTADRLAKQKAKEAAAKATAQRHREEEERRRRLG